MIERPIIFSASSVHAILAGLKTQTRRLVKTQWRNDDVIAWYPDGDGDWIGTDPDMGATWVLASYPAGWGALRRPKTYGVRCPYGKPGDRLWVREAWAPGLCARGLGSPLYRANCNPHVAPDRWRPPIYMPRTTSRITLDVVAVRIERVQAISDADILAEGVTLGAEGTTLREAWAAAWDALNAKRGAWASNPWIWVVTFRRAA